MDARVTVKQNGDFRRIYRRGRSAVAGGVVVYCLKNRQGMSRLGVTVSTKLGHAVVRNRVRRRFRELYRLHKGDMLPGYDIIMVARVRAAELPYAKLEKQYLRCLTQLGLLREDARKGFSCGSSAFTGGPSPLCFRPAAATSPPALNTPWRPSRNTVRPRAAGWRSSV